MVSKVTLFAPAIAVALSTSALAQGDDCTVPVTLTGTGTFNYDTTGLSTSGFDGGGSCFGGDNVTQDGFFVWTAPAAGDYDFDTEGTTYDTQISIHDGGGCAATCLEHDDDGGTGLLSFARVTGVAAGQTLLIQVGGFGANEGPGILNINTVVPCLALPDDGFEDNDDCGFEASLGSGTFDEQTVSMTDWDYFIVDVADGDTLQVDIFFTHAVGDTDIFLYDIGACADFASGDVGTTGSLTSGFTGSDNEQIIWTNSTGADTSYIIKINIWPQTTTGDCNTYDMVVTGADGMGGQIGTNYCDQTVPNSSGNLGELGAEGSDVASDNNFTLVSSGLPDGQFSYFVASQTQGFMVMPNNSQGNLCVLGNIARFNRPGEVGAIAGGSLSIDIDLTNVPEPGGLGVILAGETWNFQGWHRDSTPGTGPTSNFTNGLSVPFQ